MPGRFDRTHIRDTRFGAVPLTSAEGLEALQRHGERQAGKEKETKKKIVESIEARGMEDLAATERRLLKPLQERMSGIFQEKKLVEQHLKNPMSGITIYGGMDEQNINRQLKEYVDRNERTLMALNNEGSALQARQKAVVEGMGNIAQGRKPSAEFIQYLDEMERNAARRVAESGKKEQPDFSAPQEFKASREELKALADLHGFVDSL